MKKILFGILSSVFIFSSNTSNAVEKGDFVIQPSLNLGNYGIASGVSGGRAFGVTGNFDYAVHDYVSVGGFVGFNSVRARNADWNYGRIGFGARGIFHFWQLIDDKVAKDLKSEKVDFYVPLHLGYNVYTGDGASGGDFNMGLAIGIKYYFNPKIGIAFETGGTELSWAKLGVAIKM